MAENFVNQTLLECKLELNLMELQLNKFLHLINKFSEKISFLKDLSA